MAKKEEPSVKPASSHIRSASNVQSVLTVVEEVTIGVLLYVVDLKRLSRKKGTLVKNNRGLLRSLPQPLTRSNFMIKKDIKVQVSDLDRR